jgi:gliding motility-associated-like protein
MRQSILFFSILALLSSLSPLLSQVPAPNLFCVSNQGDGRDTLRFEVPTVGCGDADSLLIFQSDMRDGPYTLIETVQNLGATAIRIPNSGNDIRYYYLQLAANCPDNLSPPSDTLSNPLPPLVPITYVSVENGETIIRWTDPSPQVPKIKNYIIYRVDVGTEPIDTIPAPNSNYIDANSAANLQSEFYYVQALDGCGLTGSLGNQPHNTIFLEDSIDACGRRALLSWTAYEAWDSVAFYSVYVSENQGPAVRLDSLGPDSRTAEIPNLDAQIEYTYYIEAHHPDSTYSARSNARTRTPDIRQGIRNLNFWGADVDGNSIELQWEWNDDAELVSAQITNLSGNLDEIDLQNLIDPLQENNILPRSTPLAGEQSLSFYIETLDTCDSLQRSDTISTAFISATALPSFENEIEITRPRVGSAVTLNSCRLLRYRNNQVETSLPVSPGQNTYSDPFDPFDRPNDQLCYQLECLGQAETLSGETQDFQLRSNITCPSREIRIQVPNALRPEGENPEFKPLILFENAITSYTMQIFDRWGRLLFETNEPQQGWRGQSGGSTVPAGVYVYRIFIEQRQGAPITKNGNVTLIR